MTPMNLNLVTSKGGPEFSVLTALVVVLFDGVADGEWLCGV